LVSFVELLNECSNFIREFYSVHVTLTFRSQKNFSLAVPAPRLRRPGGNAGVWQSSARRRRKSKMSLTGVGSNEPPQQSLTNPLEKGSASMPGRAFLTTPVLGLP